MQPLNNTETATPTLRNLIQGLGRQNNVVDETLRLLKERGIKPKRKGKGNEEFSRSAIYTTIERNGENNADIERALLDAIAAEKQAQAETTTRRQALAA